MIDPRIAGAKKRLSKVKRIFVVLSGKGGVGKTLFSSTLALVLAKKGINVGLFDMDFQGPTCHVVLGARDVYPEEEKGIIPPKIHDVRFLSIIFFLGENPAPLRGSDRTNVILELLSITNWNDTEVLIIDMPPGSGDDVLDVIKFIDNKEFIVISTPSALSIETVSRLLRLLKEQDLNVLGLVENMSESEKLKGLAEKFKVSYLGNIPFDPSVEDALGNPLKLLDTNFAKHVEEIAIRII